MKPPPSVGSVWSEHDRRCALRTVRVHSVVGDRVVVETLTEVDGREVPTPRKTSVKRDSFYKRFDPIVI